MASTARRPVSRAPMAAPAAMAVMRVRILAAAQWWQRRGSAAGGNGGDGAAGAGGRTPAMRAKPAVTVATPVRSAPGGTADMPPAVAGGCQSHNGTPGSGGTAAGAGNGGNGGAGERVKSIGAPGVAGGAGGKGGSGGATRPQVWPVTGVAPAGAGGDGFYRGSPVGSGRHRTVAPVAKCGAGGAADPGHRWCGRLVARPGSAATAEPAPRGTGRQLRARRRHRGHRRRQRQRRRRRRGVARRSAWRPQVPMVLTVMAVPRRRDRCGRRVPVVSASVALMATKPAYSWSERQHGGDGGAGGAGGTGGASAAVARLGQPVPTRPAARAATVVAGAGGNGGSGGSGRRAPSWVLDGQSGGDGGSAGDGGTGGAGGTWVAAA